MTIHKKQVAFGASQKRFGNFTSHPNLDRSGLFSTRSKACDPCFYSPKDIRDVYPLKNKVTLNKEPWRSRKELEEWAKNLGYRNQKIIKSRRWINSILGPAWHEINETKHNVSNIKNLGFGRGPRFIRSENTMPGPGTYYKAVPFKSTSYSRPTFENGEPCRFKDTSPIWSLACNRYKIIDKESIEERCKKVISVRGPYDLFTGLRDGSTIKNHFSNSGKTSAATWPYKLNGSFKTYEQSNFGTLNKTNMDVPFRGRLAITDISMSIKKSKEPGPASYNVDQKRSFKSFKYGFNSSYDRPPGYKRVVVWPGVGRYNVKDSTCSINVQGHKHVFRSQVERTIGAYIPQPMNSF